MTTPNEPQFSLSDRARRTTAQPIGYLITTALRQPNLISLAAGLVDYDTLPGEELAQISAELLADAAQARKSLQYGTTEGLAELRHLLLEHMAKLDGLTSGDDLDASPDDVVITTGSQQLLYILTDILVNPGDIVITEWPSYFVYTTALRTFGADVRCVETDDDGVLPDSLEAVLTQIARDGQLGRVKIVYICDYHQNPTGNTLAAERRPVILDIIRRFSMEHRILLIEDAAYRELTYEEGGVPPSIKRYDEDNRYVALLQTFSKPFSPGLKTGYGLLPRDLVEPVLLQKGSHDFGSTNLAQHLLLHAMRSGAYHEHVKVLCEAYRRKRDAMLAALDKQLGSLDGANWTRPRGGLYVWLTLPDHVDTGRESMLFGRAIAEGVLYVPGAFCYPDQAGRAVPTNHMRLSFGVTTESQIHEGVKRLARAIRAE